VLDRTVPWRVYSASKANKKRMRAALESLLRARKLDVTLTTAAPWSDIPVDRLAPTGCADLDAALSGGLRRGHLSEITGAWSSGRSTIAAQMLGAATARGEAVAFIDACDTFDPPSADAHGVSPAGRWLRPRRPRSRGRARRGHPAISVDDVDAHRANHRRLRHGGARDRIGTHRAQSAWRHDRARIEPRAVVRAWQPRAIVQGSGAGAASGERPMSPRRISTQRPQRPLVITLFVSVTSVVSEWS